MREKEGLPVSETFFLEGKKGFLLRAEETPSSENESLDVHELMKALWWPRPAWILLSIMNAH